ncbi:2-polyprenyl-6-methoxyphenol hydroxylase-like FAD-dependent oxidoreductase [Kibdelosporangium banguiense]|uniref:2-polyprenyl-6-methoxyphenol hydroxylase-like FAD-dependent oxidoreductase n=1 Tax=Kibdelosporangium banguiense TaxID=1365924 RepID=A0ABS4TIR5_9PSEU|nr:FAD-dependent monooxygenase [Kibdelosporangium banguiense]MBP2324312.1 2-polyprenyl-6-methoxyphenol hydroxylase-like FAD-dependent oxidoreductase [Kibdelosporangium banguiense]
MNILISGAGVAGPAAAFWLQRYGFMTTVVERAPALRSDGFAVDFRGSAHIGVLTRMGILDDVRAIQTNMGTQNVISATGKTLASLPSEFMSGEVEVLRGELSHLLYERTKDNTEYVFGDHITGLSETPGGVDVTFAHAAPRTFDLVIGADGLHSGVRSVAFGEESRFSRFHDYYLAGFATPNYLGLENRGVMYNEPGKGVMFSAGKRSTGALLVFASSERGFDRLPADEQKQLVAETFAEVGWETARFVEAMWQAPDFYFDSISTIHMPGYTSGRITLLGDAGYGATCGGMGTGAAIVCAYVLAGELARADYRTAFGRYESLVRDYVTNCQKSAERAGSFLAPRTRRAIWTRNKMYRLLGMPAMTNMFNKMTTKAASNIALPSYDEVCPARPASQS